MTVGPGGNQQTTSTAEGREWHLVVPLLNVKGAGDARVPDYCGGGISVPIIEEMPDVEGTLRLRKFVHQPYMPYCVECFPLHLKK